MALVDKREDGTAIYNRTKTGVTLYLHSVMDNLKSEYSKEDKAKHLETFVNYNFYQHIKE